MPICPGCERTVSYDRLDVHERHCHGIWGKRRPTAAALEQIDQRLQRLEADFEPSHRSKSENRSTLGQR